VVDIVLVRHAATTWSGARYCGVSDPGLSASGQAAAARLGIELAAGLARDTRLVSSPSRRAIETDLRVVIDPRWREADLGIAEGRTFEELRAVAPSIAEALARGELAIDWPDGETHASLAARVADAWHDLIADARPAIVVTHGGPLMHAVALAEGREVRAGDLIGPAAAVRVSAPADGASSVTVLPSRP
jgi:broad specificity phosphatase PhoE